MSNKYEDQVDALGKNLRGLVITNAGAIKAEECAELLHEITDPQVLEPSDFGSLIARYMERADYASKQELMQFLADQKVALLFPHK